MAGLMDYVEAMMNAGMPRYSKGPTLANIGIPIAFTSDSNITKDGMPVMPDGAVYKEVSTAGIDGARLKDRVSSALEANRGINFGSMGNMKLKNVNDAMVRKVKKTRGYNINRVPGRGLFGEMKNDSKNLGLYRPEVNKLYVRKLKDKDHEGIVADHEITHMFGEVPRHFMYRDDMAGAYTERLNERISNIFASRQLPDKYIDASSPYYIHPMAVYDKDSQKFVNASDAYMKSSMIAKPKFRNTGKGLRGNIDRHIDNLNSMLDRDPGFLEEMNMLYDKVPYIETNRAIGQGSQWNWW